MIDFRKRIRTLLLCLLMSQVLLLTPGLLTGSAQAQEPWPPFYFDLIPSSENGQIIYKVALYSQVDWQLSDVTIKLRPPAGTRFVEGRTQPDVNVTFDGQEVTLIALGLDQFTEENFLVFEITDPQTTVFTTQGWIAWKGANPGDYLAEPVSFDITKPALNWAAPSPSRLQLGLGAAVTNEVITYRIYPKTVSREILLDARINFQIPEGTTYLSAEAPGPVTSNFNGQEVGFSIPELVPESEIGALVVRVSSTNVTVPVLTTQVWAGWKNGQELKDPNRPARPYNPEVDIDIPIPAEEQFLIDLILTDPRVPQTVVFDATGDVPFGDYDLTSLAFRENQPDLTVAFNTVEAAGSAQQPIDFTLFVDSDCNIQTGERRENRGADYRIMVDRETGGAGFIPWDSVQADWGWAQYIGLKSVTNGQTILTSVPPELIGAGSLFCWAGWASNQSEAFNTRLPRDITPNEAFFDLTQYQVVTTPATTVRSKLAVPQKNEQGLYDIHIYTLPEAEEIDFIANAHQPNFRADGQRLLINHEGTGSASQVRYDLADGRSGIFFIKDFGALENIYEYNLAEVDEVQVNDEAQHTHPFYNPTGSQVVYGRSHSGFGPEGPEPSTIYIQCSLLPPHREASQRCRDLAQFGVLVAPGQTSEIKGSHPVWTRSDLIAYNGCDDWAQSTECGIYVVGSWATRALGDGATPIQLTQDPSDIPSDTKGDLIAFTSARDGNWEAYVMNLDGTGLRNVSQSPASNDGLPTISPDGKWVAFVSDRDGRWAVWQVPVGGGPIEKRFNLPANTPWGTSDPSWLDERMSWSP